MAQAALRIVDDEIDTSIVRRLMARPLRVVAEMTASVPDAEHVPAVEPKADGSALEVSRLRAEVMVMKAVLGAERREADRLRTCITRMDESEPLTPEAQAVRDRWAALVDTLLHTPS